MPALRVVCPLPVARAGVRTVIGGKVMAAWRDCTRLEKGRWGFQPSSVTTWAQTVIVVTKHAVLLWPQHTAWRFQGAASLLTPGAWRPSH